MVKFHKPEQIRKLCAEKDTENYPGIVASKFSKLLIQEKKAQC